MVWIDTERGEDVISYLCSMARENMMEEKFCSHRMVERKAILTLRVITRWSVSRTRKTDRRRGHRSMRKHVMQRQLSLRVVNKCSFRASGHDLLRTDKLFSFVSRDITLSILLLTTSICIYVVSRTISPLNF
jgi:hypothetical protein